MPSGNLALLREADAAGLAACQRRQLSFRARTGRDVMHRNFLLILIGVLAVVAVVAGYLYYQERQSGIDIEINENGISIDGK